MSLILTGTTTLFDRPAIYTITVELVNRAELIARSPLPLPEGVEPVPIGGWMTTGTHMPITLSNSGESVAVSYRDILTENASVNPMEEFISTTVKIGFGEKPPRISEIVDYLRREGRDEATLQQWLAEEAAYEAGQKG